MSRKLSAVVEKTFIFRNTSDELYPLLKDILSFIASTISEDEFARIGGKSKLILIELFTNSLKHSDANETIISFEIDEDSLSITKTDSAKPFNIPSSQYSNAVTIPVAQEMLGQNIVVYRDDMSSLYCLPESEYTLSFVVKDFDVDVPPVPTNLLEHFGLMIIAKASDRFSFKFNPELQTNNFTAFLNL